jgi:FtsP/CotA-like multicopper oxidase with cupredoxin domain
MGRWFSILEITKLLLLCFALVASSFAAESISPIVANQNHTPAGVLRDGVLTIQLEIAKGEWHPEAEDGITLSVYAFGEAGHPLQNPAPLIRVSQGTEIRVSLHNRLAVPITVHGLAAPDRNDDNVRLAAGETQEVRFKATRPGLYVYWGASQVNDLKLRYGIDSELTGALVVDPPGTRPKDEIFVLEMMSEHPGANARQTLATINGKSWPYTQRFQYEVGQPARWRWINATNEPHALHLHGFYFRIDAFNRGGQVEDYNGDSRPMVVTQRITQGETFDMSWSPDRPGNWLFHCHMFQHMIPAVVPKLPGLSVRSAVVSPTKQGEMNDVAGMGQLVLGITVPETGQAVTNVGWHPERKLQLEISERGGVPRYALRLRDPAQHEATPKEPGLIGPPIVLTRGQPVEIEVVNQLRQPTAIHWHGIELESYYDGVPGWSGTAMQIAPPIAPGTSFVARMAPPRSGTFIYHTHWHDPSQLTNGIYGPLIVLPEGEKFDPTSDLTFVFSIADFSNSLQNLALINGTPQSEMLQLQTGKKYRFRLINISTNNQGMQVSLRDPSGLADWRVIAKDGADLPSNAMRMSKAQLTIAVGETYDVEFSTATPQDLLLDLLRPATKMHTIQTLAFSPAGDR